MRESKDQGHRGGSKGPHNHPAIIMLNPDDIQRPTSTVSKSHHSKRDSHHPPTSRHRIPSSDFEYQNPRKMPSPRNENHYGTMPKNDGRGADFQSDINNHNNLPRNHRHNTEVVDDHRRRGDGADYLSPPQNAYDRTIDEPISVTQNPHHH